MNNRFKNLSLNLNHKVFKLFSVTTVIPALSHAQTASSSDANYQVNTLTYIVSGALLVVAASIFFGFKRRLGAVSDALKDVTGELSTTRKKLVDTSSQLEVSELEHKATSNRYQGILFDAHVGMFQMDLNGKCSYVNTALQEMSGLYPKKAMAEGLPSAIHPDDRAAFKEAWNKFVESNETFNQVFRFRLAKEREVHVTCRANKVLNEKKEVESYIGWVTDVTPFHEEKLKHQATTARYDYFVSETIEGYYQLVPETPIPLGSSPAKMAETLMEQLSLGECNETFAAMYGSKPAELEGKAVGELTSGCGPFKTTEAFKQFVEAGYKSIDLESVRQDSSGSRLNLINSVVGIIEDNKLVGIWGTQRNITQQKREKAELASQVKFMHRILNALPADVHVKDTRCRYVYASKKLADRTGIAQEDWVGKTIFEVMPAAPRDHDHTAIDTMKTNKLSRFERPYEARGKSGWMETIQIPLVSDEGLVEGVVGLSLEVSERKKNEETVLRKHKDLQEQLKQTRTELSQSQSERSKAASSLSQANQKLRIADTEKANREHEFKEHLIERKHSEETLRRSEEGLLARQQQLSKDLTDTQTALEAETDKRKKWEELLAIKENELLKIEEHTKRLNEFYEQECTRREQSETNLSTSEASLEKSRKELESISGRHQQETERLEKELTAKFDTESKARKQAESKLAKSEEFLQSTQDRVTQMTEQHADELEKEVAQRKEAAEKLIQSMDELDELKQQFNQRIDTDTKTIKQELAKKQIREKALRKHEHDLEERIKELEHTLQLKTKEQAEEIQAREGAEVQKQQVEQKMEQLSKRQSDLIDRETQKLNLNIAEIRLDEVKLRKRAGDLEREKEVLEETLQIRNRELEKSTQQIKRIEATLADTQAELKQLTGDQSKVISKETKALHQQLEEMKQTGNGLHEQLNTLLQQKNAVEQDLEKRNTDLTNAAREYRKVVDAYKDSQSKLKQLSENQDSLIADSTKGLNEELLKLRASDKQLRSKEKEYEERLEARQEELHKLAQQLKVEAEKRVETQKAMKELQTDYESSQENADALVLQQTKALEKQVAQYQKNEAALKQQLDQSEKLVLERDSALTEVHKQREETSALLKEAETRLAGIKQEHQAELKKSVAEVTEVSRMNSELVDELNETVQQTLYPVVKTTLLLEKAENLSSEQKQEMVDTNLSCRTLIDTMSYRAELTHLADGRDEVKSTECDLHGLMAEVDRQFCHRADTKRLFFAVSFAQYQAANNVPKLVETDDNKLRKLLSILLGYAVEKTEKGRLGLHATRKPSEGGTTHIAFELTYTGREEKDSLLSNIFDANVETVVDMKYGLTLARRYISMLGGVPTLEYRDAGITALTVEFPFKRVGSESGKQAGAA